MEQQVIKWQKHIGELVDEMLDINERRYVFKKQRNIIKKNSRLQSENNIFILYLFRNYAEAQVVAITRVVENNGRTKSFVTLLNDLLNNFNEIIQSGKLDQIFIDQIEKSNTDNLLKSHFKIERKNNLISWEQINSDKFDLLKETAKLKIFRDKWIAHIDQKRKPFTIQYDEINNVVDFLNQKIQKYYTLLTNNSLDSLLASGIEEDEEIFTFAWLDD